MQTEIKTTLVLTDDQFKTLKEHREIISRYVIKRGLRYQKTEIYIDYFLVYIEFNGNKFLILDIIYKLMIFGYSVRIVESGEPTVF